MAFAKFNLTQTALNIFNANLSLALNKRIAKYQAEIYKTDFKDIILYREEEISDLQGALEASKLYLEGSLEEAIKILYRRSNDNASKEHCLWNSLSCMRQIEKKFIEKANEANE